MLRAELAAFFTEDAEYHNIPLEPVTGREDIARTIASVLSPGRPGIENAAYAWRQAMFFLSFCDNSELAVILARLRHLVDASAGDSQRGSDRLWTVSPT